MKILAPLTLLSSLALAAVASADPYSAAYAASYVRAAVSADAGVTLAPITQQEYHPRRFHDGVNYYDLDTGDPTGPTNAEIGYTFDTAGQVNAANDVVSLTATSAMNLFPTAATDPTYAVGYMGRRAFFTLTNTTGADAQVRFTLTRSGSFAAHADRPSNAAGDNILDYAGSDTAGGGVGELDALNNIIGTSYYDDTYGYTYNFGTGVISPDLNGHFDLTNQNYSFTLGAGETHRYEVWTLAAVEVGYLNPVPEPASMLALGVGVLDLLRRRRKA